MINKLKKLAYSSGAVATALSYQAFSTYSLFFYVDIKRLEAGLAAIGMLIYGAWNAVNDPLAGIISDRTRTRWGRRIPYIAGFLIPFGIIYYLVWTPGSAPLIGQMKLFFYFLIFICLFDLCYTVVILNWASLFPEMFPSLAERAQVNCFRQAFGMLGLMIGIALPPLIYSQWGWNAMGALFGSLIVLFFGFSLLGSRENKKFLEQPSLGIKEAFSASFQSKSFRVFVSSNLLIQYAFTMILAMLPFYAKYLLQIEAAPTSLLLFTAFAVAMIMVFGWRRITVKAGAKNTYLAALAVLMLALVPFLLIKSYWASVFFAGAVGVGLAGIILISDVLISDVIDEDELKTNCRREGIYFGLNALVCRFAIALEAASIGAVFLLTGYSAQLVFQPQSFLWGIRLLIAGLPMIALIGAFAIMWFYPLAGAYLEEVKVEVEKRRVKAP